MAAWLAVAGAHAKLNVVATTPDLGAIAREIGGKEVDVLTLAKPTEAPHFVDAKPNFVVRLNRADALIEGGAELEGGWLSPLLEQWRNTKLAPGAPGRIVASQGISLLEGPATLDRSKGDVHAAGNPHYLADPAALLAKRMRAMLIFGWLVATFGGIAGLFASWHFNFPTGAAIVCVPGAALVLTALAMKFVRRSAAA